MVEMASIGPPSAGTVTVVFATMESFPCNKKYVVSDSNTGRTRDLFWFVGSGNWYALRPTILNAHEPSWDHHTWSAVEPIDRFFF